MNERGYLRRLPPEFYRGDAWVHWVMTIQDRRQGYCDPRFLYKFRELQAHIGFRYQIACVVYCLMPDHMHFLWTGLTPGADQLVAAKAIRRELNRCLERIQFRLQAQAYDHVLKSEEVEGNAVETIAEYIARNPERKGLIPVDHFARYPYTGCLIPGFPSLRLFGERGWDDVWRTIAYLRRTELFRYPDPNRQPN